MPKLRYGTKFKFIFFIILLENQIVIHSFASGAQPSSHKLSVDVTGVVLVLLAGDLMSMGGTYTATPVSSCFDGRSCVLDYSYGHSNMREEPF